MLCVELEGVLLPVQEVLSLAVMGGKNEERREGERQRKEEKRETERERERERERGREGGKEGEIKLYKPTTKIPVIILVRDYFSEPAQDYYMSSRRE